MTFRLPILTLFDEMVLTLAYVATVTVLLIGCWLAFHAGYRLASLCQKWLLPILALLIPLAANAQPTTPVAIWYQPSRNLPTVAKLGVTVAIGPEVENGRNLPPDILAAGKLAWIQATQDAKLKCILKQPTGPLPPNCVGIIFSVDEPNGKGIPAAALLGERDDLRARYPGVPLYLSLAGDKITSANFAKPAELQAYKDYAALADVLTVDVYAMNRNASRYKTTWTGDAVSKLIAATGKPVWAWVEMNDQQLPPPVLPDVNRAPTDVEIKATVDDSIARGATGIGWFPTCDSGKYGWPASYWPTVDRRGVSIQPQIDMVERISKTLTPPTPDPIAVLQSRIAGLEQNDAARAAQIEALTNRAAKAEAGMAAVQVWLNAAPRPTTQPGGGQ